MNWRKELTAEGSATQERAKRLFTRFGVGDNPFPAAGQSSEHPRMETSADKEVQTRLVAFVRDMKSQVMVVVGTQGTGKSNLLRYYETQLRDILKDQLGYYVIRYFSDPEPSFDGVLRRLFQELGSTYLTTIRGALRSLGDSQRNAMMNEARGIESRTMLQHLMAADDGGSDAAAQAALDWLTGQRVLNEHKELLGVRFRLDTVEAKTQALRDLIMVGVGVGKLKGVFLLMDELEKQDYSVSKTVLLRYLSAIRAIVDSFPKALFLMVALTPAARDRYFEMLPAFQGRLQNAITIKPLMLGSEAVDLWHFYHGNARERAANRFTDAVPGGEDLVAKEDVSVVFEKLRQRAVRLASEGVTQRDFLNALNQEAENRIARERGGPGVGTER